MRKILPVALATLAVVVALLFLLPERDSDRAGGDVEAQASPLAFVPADTPYLFANLEPLPPEVQEQWFLQLDHSARLWSLQLRQMRRIAATGSVDPAAQAWLDALQAEFEGRPVREIVRSLGFDPQARMALYGIGLVPVLRLTLGDADALRAFVTRIEQRAGSTLPRASVDGVDYWSITSGNAPVRGVVAIIGHHLVVTLAPREDEAALRQVLGLQRPAASHADGAVLRRLNADNGYLAFGSGYVDSARLLAIASAPVTPLEQAFLGAFAREKPRLDPTCEAEAAALADALPRLSGGYTRLDPKRLDLVTRIELREDLARELQSLRSPLPGLDQAQDVPFHVGFGLRLSALPPLVNRWAGAVAESPWTCPALVPLNAGFASARQQLNNPALFATAAVLRGVHAVATTLRFESSSPLPELGGKLLFATDNPSALFGMARSVAPELAGVTLASDGSVTALPALSQMPLPLPMFAASAPGALGVAIGAGEDADLPAFLRSDEDAQPLFVAGYSGALLAEFNRSMMARAGDAAASAGDAEFAQEQRALADAMAAVYESIERAEMRIEFGARGIEIHQRASVR